MKFWAIVQWAFLWMSATSAAARWTAGEFNVFFYLDIFCVALWLISIQKRRASEGMRW